MIMTIGLIRASRTGKFRYRTAHPKSLFNGERGLLGLARAMVDVQAAIYSPGGGFWLPILQYDPKSSSPRSNEVIENAPELPIQQNPYSHFAGGVPFSGNRDREALTERKFKGSGGFVANG